MSDVVYKPTEWQTLVMQVPPSVNLFLGGGRGRGATTCALFILVRVCEQYPGSHHLFVRNNLRSLNEVEDSLQMMLTGAYGARSLKVNRSDHMFKLPNGSTIEFAPMAEAADVAKLQGRSFSTITADETGEMSPAQIKWLDSLRANMRGGDCPRRMVWLANPSGRAHSVLNNRFVRRAVAWTVTTLEDGMEWVYCPGNHRNNEHLPKDYNKSLFAAAGRDEHKFSAWAYGRWDVASGAVVGDLLDPTVQMFRVEDLPFRVNAGGAVYTFLSGDWGQTAPSAAYLCVKMLSTVGKYPVRSLLLIDEVHSADPDDYSIGLQWNVSYLADRINLMFDKHGVRNRQGIFDNARGLGDDTVHKLLASQNIFVLPPKKDIRGNLAAFRELAFNSLKGNGRPGFWASDKCEAFWSTVPELPRSRKDPEIPDSNAVDHFWDAGGAYAASHEPRIIRYRANMGF